MTHVSNVNMIHLFRLEEINQNTDAELLTLHVLFIYSLLGTERSTLGRGVASPPTFRMWDIGGPLALGARLSWFDSSLPDFMGRGSYEGSNELGILKSLPSIYGRALGTRLSHG